MAKFCSGCGRPLQEGEICMCRQTAAVNANQQQANIPQQPNYAPQFNAQPNYAPQYGYTVQPQAPSQFGIFCKEMMRLIPAFLKQPASIMKQVVQKEDYRAGLFFLIIQAILLGLCAMLTMGKDYGVNFGMYSYYYVSGDTFAVFVKSLAVFGIQFFLLAGLFYAISRIFSKETGSFKALIGVMGVATIPASFIVILCMLLTVAKLHTIWLFANVLLAALSIIYSYIGVRESLKLTEDKTVWVVAISYIITFIGIYLILVEALK